MEPALKLLPEPPAGGEENCYVESRLGVVALIRSVASVGPRAAAYFEGGEKFIHTSILAVVEEPPSVVFEKSRDSELNKLLLSAPEVTLVTSDHGVPVQFVCSSPGLTRHGSEEAFSAPLPRRVLRLQRRDAYRLQGAPLLKQVTCHVFREDKADPKVIAPAVFDVSCGGISIAVPNGQPKIERESRHKCRIELPAFVRFDAGMLVHGWRDVTLPDGTAARCYGVEFLNLDPTAEVLLQRFITEEQRKMKKVRG